MKLPGQSITKLACRLQQSPAHFVLFLVKIAVHPPLGYLPEPPLVIVPSSSGMTLFAAITLTSLQIHAHGPINI